MVYKWKPTARISKIDPQKAGELMKNLADNEGLTARNLVEVSRPKDALLHSVFEWDNNAAAEKYREHQARNVINSIEVVVEEAVQEPVRAFFKVAESTTTYSPTEMLVKSQSGRDAILRTALREFNAVANKYRSLEEFCNVFAALDTVAEELEAS